LVEERWLFEAGSLGGTLIQQRRVLDLTTREIIRVLPERRRRRRRLWRGR
jgi:hypothetical protein